MEVMLHKNEKKAIQFPAVCSGGCSVGHMGSFPLRLRKPFPHWLQIHLLLVLFAGYAVCNETSTAASTSMPTVQSAQGQEIYFLEVTVDIKGQEKNITDIDSWLSLVFENNLQSCVSTPTISTTPATNSTLQSPSTTMLQVNTTTTSTTNSTQNATTITTATTQPPSNSTISTTSQSPNTTTPDTTTSQSPNTTTSQSPNTTTVDSTTSQSPNTTTVDTTTSQSPNTTTADTTMSQSPNTTTVDTTTSQSPNTTTADTTTSQSPNTTTVDTTTSQSPNTTTIDTTTSQSPSTTVDTTTSQSPSTTTVDTSTSQNPSTTTVHTTTSQSPSTTTVDTSTSQNPSTTTADTTTSQSPSTTTADTTTSQSPSTTTVDTSTSQSPSTTTARPSTSQSPSTTTARPTTSQSPSTTTGLTTSQTNKPTTVTTATTLQTSPVTSPTFPSSSAATPLDGSVTVTTATTTKHKPSNNPNPNSGKSLVRFARQIQNLTSSGVTTGLLQDLEVTCLNTTDIRNTVCYVTLTLKDRVSPCCILLTLCAASKTSSNISVTGKQVNTVGPLSQNNTSTQCSNSSQDSCVYTGPSGEACDATETAYMTQTNSTQCGAENKCNCSAYCSKTEAYYIFNMSSNDPKLAVSFLGILMSGLTKLHECTPGTGIPCQSSNTTIVSKYKNVTIACSQATILLSCTVVLSFSEEVPICAVSEVVTTLLQSQNISINGEVTRAAICGSENPLGSTFTLVKGNLKPDLFCQTNESHPFSCQNGKSVVVMLDEQCVWLPTVSPNVTIVQPNTTLSANETNNTTASFNATTTPGNESTTSTAANSSLAMANALLDLSKDASKLNSSQVDQLVSVLEKLLSGPNVSLALGNISVQIVSNLQKASLQAVDNSKNRIMGIVDTVGQKLVLSTSTVSILSDAVALSVQKADGTSFKETYFSISDPNNVQVGVPRVRRAAEKDSSVPQGSIKLPSTLTENLTAEQQQLVSRVQFNFYQKSTLFQDKSLKDKILNSGILGASVANVSISGLQDDIIIYLRNTNPVPTNYSATCVFWDFTLNDGSGGWNKNGCHVRNSTDNEITCGCNHLTSFAILLDLSRQTVTSREQATILTFITYIGCGISAIFLAITLLTYLAFGKLRKDIPSKILIQLCLSLLLLNLVFLVDAWLALYPNALGLCISTAWFLHYFLLVAFTWMGLEAVHMYIALVKVFNSHISRYMVKFSFAGWGIPMIVVIIVIAIDKDNYGLLSYGKFSDGTTDEFCWIKNDIAFYVAVVAYFCVIFLFNLVMFVVVLVQLCRIKRQNPHNLQHRTTLQDVRSVMGITILLGLTWGFAFFAWGPLNLPFMYLFAIFNSLQGFFIFIFHCAVKENVRRQWRTYLCCGKMRLAENSEWSRTATQKTTKKSSGSSNSSQANNSSSSASFLGRNSSEQINGIGNPLDDRTITADEDSRMDVILNELNSQHRQQ